MADFDYRKIRQLDFTLLLVLQALLRHRQTTRAATELGLSPSAISHALKRLRLLLGNPLFLRRPHGLEPTRRALEISAHVDALLRDGGRIMGMTTAFDAATARRDFRIVAPDHVGTLLAGPLLALFQRRAPQARFAIGIGLGDEALEELRRDQVDIALGQFAPGEDFAFERLYTDRYVLVARRHHPRIGSGPRIDAARFEMLDHVAVSVGGDFRVLTDSQFRALGLTRRVVATVPRFASAFEAVAATDAVAIAPERLAQAHARPLKLRMVALPKPLPPLQIRLARSDHADAGVTWLATGIKALLPD